MPECDVDIDSLGNLTLEHFERKANDEDLAVRYLTANVSPSSYCYEHPESPISSTDEARSPHTSDSCCVSSNSDDDLGEAHYRRKRKYEKRQGKQAISKRNERERKRVRLISEGFSTLRNHVLGEPTNRKVPKLQILRRAISYIKAMQDMLDESDQRMKIENEMERRECYVQPAIPTSLVPHSVVKPEEMFPCYQTSYDQRIQHRYPCEQPIRKEMLWYPEGYSQ